MEFTPHTKKMDKRRTNIELLRIIAMFMLVSYHAVQHGIVSTTPWSNGTTAGKVAISFFMPGGEIGVALFFIISGFFCIKKRK